MLDSGSQTHAIPRDDGPSNETPETSELKVFEHDCGPEEWFLRIVWRSTFKGDARGGRCTTANSLSGPVSGFGLQVDLKADGGRAVFHG